MIASHREADRVAEGDGSGGRRLLAGGPVPRREDYRLTAQLTRAIASVPANIAVGNARSSLKEYAHFLSISKGSLMEAETFLFLAIRLGYVSAEDARPALDLIIEVSKMLTSLRRRLG